MEQTLKLIERAFPTFAIATGVIACFIYLIVNISLQIRARRRLEKKLRDNRNTLKEKFEVQKTATHGHDDDEILVHLLREEIEELPEAADKEVMKKTLDRKNFNNQKQFALRIFSESGLAAQMDTK